MHRRNGGLSFQRRTILSKQSFRPYPEFNGPATVTKPADPEKLAAYQAQQHRKRGRHV